MNVEGKNLTNPYHAVFKHAQEHLIFITKKERNYLNVKESMLYTLFFFKKIYNLKVVLMYLLQG